MYIAYIYIYTYVYIYVYIYVYTNMKYWFNPNFWILSHHVSSKTRQIPIWVSSVRNPLSSNRMSNNGLSQSPIYWIV